MADDTDPAAPAIAEEAPAGAPRWVKVFMVVAAVLVVLAVVALASGSGGGHGPRRHAAVPAATGSA